MEEPMSGGLHTILLSILEQVDTWPRALVVVTFILAVVILRRSKHTRDDVKDVKRTLTSNNGGSHVKDSLDRIEKGLGTLTERVEKLEQKQRHRWWWPFRR